MPIYIVQEWQDFPQSEYGGVIVARAENRIHLERILVEHESAYRRDDSNIRNGIHKAAQTAYEVQLHGPDEILESFRT
jgi:hypothetical protein